MDDAFERLKSSPDGLVDNVPRTVLFAVGVTVGYVLIAIAVLWLAVAILVSYA